MPSFLAAQISPASLKEESQQGIPTDRRRRLTLFASDLSGGGAQWRMVILGERNRRGEPEVLAEHTKFDFLGYTFQARRSKNRWGKYFINFSPAVSNSAAKAMRQRTRRWGLQQRSDKALEDLSRMFNPILRGWINYYGRFYKSAMTPTLWHLDRVLVRWAMWKYKRLRRHQRRAEYWLGHIARKGEPYPEPYFASGSLTSEPSSERNLRAVLR